MAKKDTKDLSKDSKARNGNSTAEEELNENAQNANEESTDNNSQEISAEEVILKSEYDSLNNKMLRLQADFLNYKARTEKEKSSTYVNAVSDVLTDLLPIIDNFERAIESESSTNEEVINFKNGVKMIYDQFFSALQKRGLQEIEALNSKFDPNMHSGIAFEITDEKEEDTVIEVFQKGYVVNEKVIRPSMVKIAKK